MSVETVSSSDSLANLRDLGFGPAESRVRPGVLLRSDAPYPGDEAPVGSAWPPRTVIDLRAQAEQREGHPLADTSEIHVVPLLDEASIAAQVDGDTAAINMVDLYLAMTTGTAAERLIRIVDLMSGSTSPVLVHCAAGKDRTGVAVALVLRLVGIARQDVIDEYLLTNAAVPALLSRLRRHPVGAALSDPSVLTPGILQASREAIEAVLAHWEDRPGGTVAWYLDNGGDAETLARLRERLLFSDEVEVSGDTVL